MSEIFKDSEHFYSVLYPFFLKLRDDPKMGPAVFGSGLIVRFEYHDPEAEITIDCPNNEVIKGETDVKPVLTMTMKADVAHKFWLGKINLAMALVKRDIVSKGPMSAAMKLLPRIKGAYPMYNDYLVEIGMADARNA